MASSTFRALQHRNARLFFTGLWVSQVGSWMQTVANVIFVQRLAPEGWEGVLIGATFAAQFLPMLLGGAWSGAFADQRDRWKVTVVTQSAMAVQALVLAALTFAGLATIPVLMAMSLVLGVINTIDNPARRGVVIELVEPADITNAMALNTATMTGSRAIGPALAAFMVTAFGFGWCFLINGVSYAAIVGALLAMNRAELHRSPPAPRGGTPVRDGLRFVWNDRVLRRLFTVMVVVSTFGFNNQVAFPLLVEQRWHVEDWWYGVLLAAFSVGSVLGSLFVASRRTIDETMFQVLTLVLAVFTVLVAIAPGVWWALVLVVPMGLGAAGFLATGNGLTQLRTPSDMRSRILALVAVAFLGSTPIGAPITGLVGDLAGAEWALAYGAIICVGAVAWGVVDARRHPASALPSVVGRTVAADGGRAGTDLVSP